MTPRYSLVAILGVVLLSIAVSLAAGAAMTLVRYSGPRQLPSTLAHPVPVTILLIGGVLGTICGLISVVQIRKSDGRLTGLGLACVDLLAFPLMALDMLIFAVAMLLSMGVDRDGSSAISIGRLTQAIIVTLLVGG